MNENIFHAFVDAINSHDADAIVALMSPDHKFIDSQGNILSGRSAMKEAWEGYFRWFPDYTIEPEEVFCKGDCVLAAGFAGARLSGSEPDDMNKAWHLPASWKAVITDGKIALWQVYADTKIPFDIINANQ